MKRRSVKRVLSIILAVLMAASCFAASANAGEVKNKKSMISIAGSGLGLLLSDSKEYDVDDCIVGYKVEKVTVKNADGTTSTETYTYDDAGRQLKVVAVNKSILGVKTYSQTVAFTYDAKGNLTKKSVTSSGVLMPKTKTVDTYAYDKNGNVVSYVENGALGKENGKFSFNKNGDVLKGSIKDEYGIDTVENTYDSKGRLTKKVAISKDDDSSYKDVTTRTYDSKGNLIKEVYAEYEDGKLWSKDTTTYVYNTKGLCTKETCITKDEDGTAEYICVYSYDKNGNLIKEVCTETDVEGEKTKSTQTFEYDKKGRVIKSTYSSPYSKTTVVSTYDKKGNLIKEVRTRNSDGEISKDVEENVYNENGLLVKSSYISKEDGETTWKTVYSYSYDKKQRMTKYTYSENLYGSKESGSITVEYDKNGNVKKETESVTDSLGIKTKTVSTFSYKKLAKKVFDAGKGIRLSSYQYKYDGKAKKPLVFIDGLKKGIDFKVSYSNNVKPGKAKVTVTFVGDYEYYDPVTILFNIKKAS